MKISYNQIIDTFRAFAEAHSQISEFATGDLWEVVQHDKLTDFKYPLLFVTDSPAALGKGEITMSFEVLVMDKADEDIEVEVKSDTLLILLDTIAYFEKLYADDWKFVTIQKSGSATPFTERFDDTVTGWSLSLSLKMPLAYDECQIPYTGHTPDYPDVAVPITVSNSDDTYSVTTAVDLELDDITHTDSDLSSVILPAQTAMVCTPTTTDIDLRFNFDAAEDTTDTQTISTFEAGIYTSISDDGSSGTITVSINAGAFVAFSTLNPLTLVATDTIAIKRSTTTSNGYAQITGTY